MELRIVSVQPKLGVIQEVAIPRFKTEIPIIQLTHDGEDTVKEDNSEINSKSNSKDTDISDAMDVSNFIQSEQQHAITTSEYSSLSSLSSPPLSFSSRMPPDGQEFPPICQERARVDSQESDNLVAPPTLPKTEPPTSKMPSNLSSPSWVKSKSNSELNLSNSRSSLWKRDEHSAGSVKDKIAIFSSAEPSEPPRPLTKIYKSSENISEDKSNLYNKKNQFSKSCLCVNKIPNTQSDNQNDSTNHKSPTSNSDSHNPELNNKEKDNFEFAKPTLTHTTSFTTKSNIRLHARSQSMLDMSSLDAPWNNPDTRRLTLNTLIEQRRRGLSKLRGLVIPQTDVPIVDPILDLPEILSKETNIVSKQHVPPLRSKSENLDSTNTHQRSNSTNLQSPSWKSNTISNLPRYSPAFKRKCLQVYVMEQSSTGTISNCSNSPKTSDSVFHSDYETNNTPSLNSIPSDDKYNDVFSKSSTCSDNSSYNSAIESPKVETVKSVDITSPSNSEISFEYSYQSSNSNNSLEVQTDGSFQQNYYAKKACPLPRNKNDLSRSEDDSDNDSAVSSSQSSYISRECSPSPQDYSNNVIMSADSTNGQNTKSSNNGLSGRVLKPQSVEAINRKNILASAKCRSGRDFKNGSPLIQRKLNGKEDENVVVESVVVENIIEEQEIIAQPELPIVEEKETVETNGNNDEDETDKQSTSSLSDSVSTESVKSKESDKSNLQYPTLVTDDIKKCDNNNTINTSDNINSTLSSDTETKIPSSPSSSSDNDIEFKAVKSTAKLNTASVSLRNSTLPILRKSTFDKPERPTSMILPTSSRHDAKKRASVTDIRKQFEKFEMENQKSPTQPEPKPRTFMKSTPAKSPTTKSPTENKSINSLIPSNNKEPKITLRSDIKPSIPPKTISLPPEDLEQIIKEVNEGLDKNSILTVNPSEVIVVVLHREITGGSIGITLTGGTDYEAKEITVHKVLTGSCAHKDGRLKKGDRILSINGKKMLGLTHKESIDILKDPKPEVTLVVSPCKGKTTPVSNSTIRKASSEASIAEENSVSLSSVEVPSSKESILIRVELIKDGAGLGFSLDGGRDSPKGDKPLIIKKIFTGGAAEKCGLLQASDELIEVNGTEVYKMTRIEVWSMMKKLPDGKVSLTIRR